MIAVTGSVVWRGAVTGLSVAGVLSVTVVLSVAVAVLSVVPSAATSLRISLLCLH
jgi:hypothetical protein